MDSLADNEFTVKMYWPVIGDDGAYTAAADQLMLDIIAGANAITITEAALGAHPTTSQIVTTGDLLEAAQRKGAHPLTVATGAPRAKAALRWAWGEAEIPQWVARTLLQQALCDKADELDDE